MQRLVLARLAPAASLPQIGRNFTGSTFGFDSSAVPADANGAVGPNHFVELINCRYSVYDKSSGSRVQTMTDFAFWTNSGVALSTNLAVTDPRIIFDTYSARWFASMVDFTIGARRLRPNRFLLAVSENSDPTGTWHGVAFNADNAPNGNFADFPTLGVDTNGVYLSGDMFNRFSSRVGATLVSIPKGGLMENPPSIAGRTSFGTLSLSTRGNILQPAMTTGAASTPESVLAAGDLGDDFLPHTTLVASTIQNAAVASGATLSAAAVLNVASYTAPMDPTQPDGSENLDDGDARISACVRRVGDVLYAVHATAVNNRAAIRWYKINAVTKTLIQSGTITDSNLDLFFPSIAANDAGTVVVACNGCSSTVFVSSYAVAGETVNGTLSFGDLFLLKSGAASYQLLVDGITSRWGDYSATTVDPTDPNRFWTIQMFPAGSATWATQITELILGSPDSPQLNVGWAGTNIILSWPITAIGFRLQRRLEFTPTAYWVTVTQAHVVNGDQFTVELPIANSQAFFRLVYP
ncbi:MAG: hypothetical protein DME26_13205 [Verrucomicrobia bacterium]|nr:MAG: hypothetical protein DME26_13205 [Verrucomicrobiota bacterium]